MSSTLIRDAERAQFTKLVADTYAKAYRADRLSSQFKTEHARLLSLFNEAVRTRNTFQARQILQSDLKRPYVLTQDEVRLAIASMKKCEDEQNAIAILQRRCEELYRTLNVFYDVRERAPSVAEPYGSIPRRVHTYGPTPQTPATPYQPIEGRPPPSYQPVDPKYMQTKAPHPVIESLQTQSETLVLPTERAVLRAVAGVGHRGSGVAVCDSAVFRQHALFATRAFNAGELVAKYDGEIVTFSRAQQMLAEGIDEGGVRALRSGVWAVRGFASLDEVPHDRSLGSLAVDNLDVCHTIIGRAECRIDGIALNTRMIAITDAENASRGDTDFNPRRVHLMLMATRPIAAGDQIFVEIIDVRPLIESDNESGDAPSTPV